MRYAGARLRRLRPFDLARGGHRSLRLSLEIQLGIGENASTLPLKSFKCLQNDEDLEDTWLKRQVDTPAAQSLQVALAHGGSAKAASRLLARLELTGRRAGEDRQKVEMCEARKDVDNALQSGRNEAKHAGNSMKQHERPYFRTTKGSSEVDRFYGQRSPRQRSGLLPRSLLRWTQAFRNVNRSKKLQVYYVCRFFLFFL